MTLATQWTTSSRSGDNGNCVEVRRRADVVQVRDSKDRSGPILTFPAAAWSALVGDLRRDSEA